MPDTKCCPVSLVGQVDGTFFFSGVCCPSGTSCSCSDTRNHTLGTSCADCPDPILIPNHGGGGGGGGAHALASAGPRAVLGNDHHCGCAAAGAPDYITPRTPFRPAAGSKVLARGTASYRDGRRTRKVRWFVVECAGRRRPTTIHRVGMELKPGTALPAEGSFAATLDRRDRHYHRILLRGMGDAAFHIIVKAAGKAPKKARARAR